MTQKIKTTTFELDFVQRSLKTTGVLLIFMFIFGVYYFNFYDALAVLSAGIWSMVNLIMLGALVRTVLRPDGVDKTAAVGLALIKFPLLYAAGYFLFTAEIFRAMPLFIGLSTVLAVMGLKAASRALLKIDYSNREEQSRGMA